MPSLWLRWGKGVSGRAIGNSHASFFTGVLTMGERNNAGVGSALGWVLVPVLPVVLENTYNAVLLFFDEYPPDPHHWEMTMWGLQLGPLIGFGFLAGATLYLPDPEPIRRGPRGWVSRRSIWVTIGPWAGALVCAALGWAYQAVGFPFAPARDSLAATVFAVLLAVSAYGWLVPAVAAARRAKRLGRGWENVRRGLAWSAAFVTSLFGTFWAITEGWRAFFFDPRIVQILLATASLALMNGCAQTVTYGDVRRRELFHAMLLSWTFGLAVLWRWWSRRRPTG